MTMELAAVALERTTAVFFCPRGTALTGMGPAFAVPTAADAFVCP